MIEHLAQTAQDHWLSVLIVWGLLLVASGLGVGYVCKSLLSGK